MNVERKGSSKCDWKKLSLDILKAICAYYEFLIPFGTLVSRSMTEKEITPPKALAKPQMGKHWCRKLFCSCVVFTG